MRDCLQAWSAHDLMRLPLRHDSSCVKDNDFVAEGKHFFTIVSNEENRDTVILVPFTKIRDERRLRWPVQRRQRLIEQQGARFGYERARQGDTLALASGDLRRPPVAQTIEAEARKNFAATPCSLRHAAPAQTGSGAVLATPASVKRSAP